MAYTNLRDAREKVRNLEDFTGNSLRGEFFPNGTPINFYMGRTKYVVPAGSLYVVYSYDTPIAWIDNKGKAFITDEKFSVTTSKHMHSVYGLSDLTFAQRDKLLKRYIIREAYDPS